MYALDIPDKFWVKSHTKKLIIRVSEAKGSPKGRRIYNSNKWKNNDISSADEKK
jgi:hypothetical protein